MHSLAQQSFNVEALHTLGSAFLVIWHNSCSLQGWGLELGKGRFFVTRDCWQQQTWGEEGRWF